MTWMLLDHEVFLSFCILFSSHYPGKSSSWFPPPNNLFFSAVSALLDFFQLPVLECNPWLAPRYKLLIVDLVNDTTVTPEKEAKVLSSFLSASLL